MWWRGIPPKVRGHIWSLAIGNDLNLTPGEKLIMELTYKFFILCILIYSIYYIDIRSDSRFVFCCIGDFIELYEICVNRARQHVFAVTTTGQSGTGVSSAAGLIDADQRSVSSVFSKSLYSFQLTSVVCKELVSNWFSNR